MSNKTTAKTVMKPVLSKTYANALTSRLKNKNDPPNVFPLVTEEQRQGVEKIWYPGTSGYKYEIETIEGDTQDKITRRNSGKLFAQKQVSSNQGAKRRLGKAQQLWKQNYSGTNDKPSYTPVVMTQKYSSTLKRMATDRSENSHYIDLNTADGREIWKELYGTNPDLVISEKQNEWFKLFDLTQKVFKAIMAENWCLTPGDINPEDPQARFSRIIARFDQTPLAERRDVKTQLTISKLKGTIYENNITFFDLLVENLRKAVDGCRLCGTLGYSGCATTCPLKIGKTITGTCNETINRFLFYLNSLVAGGRRTRRNNRSKRRNSSKRSKRRRTHKK
jgi:hypothetical protein